MVKSRKITKKERNLINREFIIGLVAIILGCYNLLSNAGLIPFDFIVPHLIGNLILILAGLFLWLTAFKLSRHKYHTKQLIS